MKPGLPVGFAAIAAVLLLSGCGSKSLHCGPTLTDPGAAGFCAVTSDGWILQGLDWSRNSTRGTVVLVHGLNEDHGPFLVLAKDLAVRGWRVIAFDSRGHGQSIHMENGDTRQLSDFNGDDFLAMEHDLRALEPRIGRPPDFVVGASIGANEALRYAAASQGVSGLVLLSPGLDYHGVTTRDANKAYRGAVDYVASQEDLYPAGSAETLYEEHSGDRTHKTWQDKGHGTQMLDDQGRAQVVAWLEPR